MPDTQTILMLATGVFLVLNGLTGARTAAMEEAAPPAETADVDDDADDADRHADPSDDSHLEEKA